MDNELPDAILTESGLKITPLDAAVPDTALALIDKTSQLLPRIKITELLMDMDECKGFTRNFTQLKDGAKAKDRTLPLSAILGDAINIGLSKMAESRPGMTYAKLSWLQAKHIRDETDRSRTTASSFTPERVLSEKAVVLIPCQDRQVDGAPEAFCASIVVMTVLREATRSGHF